MGDARFFKFFRFLTPKTLRKTITRALQRRLAGLSAEMAYNAMLALFPAILALLTAMGMLEKSIEAAVVDLAGQLKEIIPDEVWTLLLDFVQGIKLSQGSGWFSLSFAAAIWVASGILSTAMNALDQIHQIPVPKRRPFWKSKLIAIFLTIGTIIFLIVASFLVIIGDFVIRLAVQQNWGDVLITVWRILGIAVVLGIIVTAIASMIRTVQVPRTEQRLTAKIKSIVEVIIISVGLFFIVNFALNYIENLIADSTINHTIEMVLVSVWQLLSWPVALGIVASAFAFIYRFGPSHWEEGTPILPGAVLAAISWAGVSALFRLYVSNFGQYNRVYGAVGAVIVMMLWLYMSSLVMLLGDQLNATVGEVMREKTRKRRAALKTVAGEIEKERERP